MPLNITHIQGGMREFERTGIYPNYLLFYLTDTRQKWKINIKQSPQKGSLKSKGKVVFEYHFDDCFCKYRKVQDDGSFSKWIKPEVIGIMRD